MAARQFVAHTGINFGPIFSLVGRLLLFLALMMLPAFFIDLIAAPDDASAFLFAFLVTAFAGGALWLAGYDSESTSLGTRDAFLLTTLAWALSCLFATLPMLFSRDIELSFAAVLFETVSGMTATGATVLSRLDQMDPGMLFWRAIMQWYGGIGVIVLALAVLPTLRVGGMELFTRESSDRSEKILPRTTDLALYLSLLYVVLTLMCLFAYVFAGMELFDAVIHAMTTLSNGGHSSHDTSLAFYQSAAIEWVAIIFMISGSMPFGLYIVMVLRRDYLALARDAQVRYFLGILVLLTALLCLVFLLSGRMEVAEGFRKGLFTATAILTTTGYSVIDYSNFGPFVIIVLMLAILLGACSGSAAGGAKTWRLVIVWKTLIGHLFSINYPHGVFSSRFGDSHVTHEVADSAFLFLFVYISGFILGGCLLSAMGYDLVTSFSASAASISNVGPGLGEVVGPSGTYAAIGDAGLWVLTGQMFLGRLEIMTVLTVFLPSFWYH